MGAFRWWRAEQEVAAIDLICESCGEANRPGSQFCSSCNTFLAWDRSVAHPEQPATAAGGAVPSSAPGGSGATPPLPQTDPGWGTPPPTWGPVPDPYAAAWNTPTAAQPAVDPGWGSYSESTCPNCGLYNTPDRRFCARCGYGFAASLPAAASAGAGQGFGNAAAQARAARKAYRRSLPPLYRWRRVMIAVLVAALVGAGLFATGRDPIGVARAGWYALNKSYVKVTPVQASVEPESATAPGSNVGALVDGSVQEWTMTWQPGVGSSCGAAADTGTIVLRFAPTRVRQIQILPGLDKSNPQRPLQPLPQAIGITFDDGTCHPFQLTTKEEQVLKVDSGTDTSTVRIGIGSATSPSPDAPQLVSITEIVVEAFPR